MSFKIVLHNPFASCILNLTIALVAIRDYWSSWVMIICAASTVVCSVVMIFNTTRRRKVI